MSGTSSNSNLNVDELDKQLAVESKRLALMETRRKIRAHEIVEKKQKRLTESYEGYGDWLSGYSDLIDRSGGPDHDFVMPISTAQDVRNGDNWPFWRSWIEHSRIRAAARLIYSQSPLVRGAIRGVGAYVIGEGMRPRAAPKHDDAPKELIEAVQAWLDDWVKDNDFLNLQREFHTRYERDGEYFPRLFPQDDGWTLLRLVEPMFVVDPVSMPTEIGKYGVITDPEDLWDVRGFWVAYDGNSGSGKQVSSTLMRQSKNNVDRQVKRGMPSISYDALELYKTTGRLLENLGTGAAIQAAIAFARQHEIAPGSAVSEFVGGLADYDTARPFTGKRDNVQRFEPGTIVDMDAGQQFVETKFSSNIQQFTTAVQALLRACAVHWNAPEWITSADSSNNNFSSSLTAESPFVKRCKQTQSEFQAMNQWAVDESLKHYCRIKRGIKAGGRLYLWEQVEHYVEIQITPATVETRNRQEEASVNVQYLDKKIKSPQTIANELNLDYEREQLNLKEHAKANPDPNQQQQPGGAPGAAGGDPMAAMAAAMGGGDAGGGEQEQQAPAEGEQEQEQPQEEQQLDANADNVMGDAGLDDLFDGLGLPEDAEEAEAEEPESPAESNDLRATVGGVNALLDLQKSVYGGEIPREAAIASVMNMLGFGREEAESMFVEEQPKKTSAEDTGDTQKQQQTPHGTTTPADDVMGMVESVCGRGRHGGMPLMEAASATWVKYQGARGGHGWKNSQTGQVLYQQEDPNKNGRHVGYVSDAGPDDDTSDERPFETPWKQGGPYKYVDTVVAKALQKMKGKPEDVKEKIREVVATAIENGVDARRNKMLAKWKEEFGDEVEDFDEFNRLGDALHLARVASYDVGMAIGTDGYNEALKTFHNRVYDWARSEANLSKAIHHKHKQINYETPPAPEDAGFPADDHIRSNSDWYDNIGNEPPELEGIISDYENGDEDANYFMLDGEPLDYDQLNAIQYYTADGYKSINQWLRLSDEDAEDDAESDDPIMDEYADRALDSLQGLFLQLKPSKTPTTVYRGLRLDHAQTLGVMKQLKEAYDSGEPISFAGYSSCSRNPAIATVYGAGGKMDDDERSMVRGGAGNDVVFEIACRKGLNLNDASAEDPDEGTRSESEVLLDHNSTFDVAAMRWLPFKDFNGEKQFKLVVQLIQKVEE